MIEEKIAIGSQIQNLQQIVAEIYIVSHNGEENRNMQPFQKIME